LQTFPRLAKLTRTTASAGLMKFPGRANRTVVQGMSLAAPQPAPMRSANAGNRPVLLFKPSKATGEKPLRHSMP
jgi:hypothetical protein